MIANTSAPAQASEQQTGNPLFLLAMDHRDSLARTVYGLTGELDTTQVQRVAAGKQLVYQGLLAAVDRGAVTGAGILVDERYGADVARAARNTGLVLAMPIERSGQAWFTLEYGSLADSRWLEHLDAFNPDYVKVLVRDNPDYDIRARRTQQDALAAVSHALGQAGRRLLLELLVPPTDDQAANLGSDYDTSLRPYLTERVITDMQWAGVEPDIWKIEGLNSAEDAERVVAAARQGERAQVECIVLGRDAPQSEVDHWLRVAAQTRGFDGFAIGRTIWEQPLLAHVRGTLSAQGVIDRVAEAYLHYTETYAAAAA